MTSNKNAENPIEVEVPEIPFPTNRRVVEIKKWLVERGLRPSQIADIAKVSDTIVHHVIKGIARSQKVERILRAYGCPEEFLQIKVA